ncbi:hypothetical protein ACRRTK_024985 [Alexandromys fortis]
MVEGRKADVWSLGVVLYFVTTGYHPFRGSTLREVEENIVIGNYDIPDDMSAHEEKLIHQILTVAPERRPFIETIIQNPWVKSPKINIQIQNYRQPINHGFPRNIIFESLRNRKCDKIMGMYLILKELTDHRLHSTTSATWTDPASPPFPVPPSTTGRYLEQSATFSNTQRSVEEEGGLLLTSRRWDKIRGQKVQGGVHEAAPSELPRDPSDVCDEDPVT